MFRKIKTEKITQKFFFKHLCNIIITQEESIIIINIIERVLI